MAYFLDFSGFFRRFADGQQTIAGVCYNGASSYLRLVKNKIVRFSLMTVGYWTEDVSDAFELETLAYLYDADPSDSNTNHQSVAEIYAESHSL